MYIYSFSMNLLIIKNVNEILRDFHNPESSLDGTFFCENDLHLACYLQEMTTFLNTKSSS